MATVILGYNSIGATSGNLNNGFQHGALPYTLAENAVALKFWAHVASKGGLPSHLQCCIYTSVAGVPAALVADTSVIMDITATGWMSVDIPLTPLLTAGDYFITLNFQDATITLSKETGASGPYWSGHAYGTAFNDPWPASKFAQTDKFSFYVEMSTPAPPVTTNAAVDPTSVALGESTEITATASSDDGDVTAAEFWREGDPYGEGEETSLAVTGSGPWTLTRPVVESSWFGVGTHTLNVHAYSAEQGWGAADTVVFEVTEAVVTSGGPGSLSIAMKVGI